jgi:hypothetical protein
MYLVAHTQVAEALESAARRTELKGLLVTDECALAARQLRGAQLFSLEADEAPSVHQPLN